MFVHASDGVPTAAARHLSRMLSREVVPALRRAVGRSLVLPEAVDLVTGGGKPPQVAVGVERESGRVVDVDRPTLVHTNSDANARICALHELGHSHELSVRKRRRILIPHLRAGVLWSEYFTERVSWAAMPGRPDISQTSTESPGDDGSAPAGDSANADFPYMLMFGLAQRDAGRGTPATRSAIYTAMADGFDEERILHHAFHLFPRWDEAVTNGVVRLLSFLDARLGALSHFEIECFAKSLGAK